MLHHLFMFIFKQKWNGLLTYLPIFSHQSSLCFIYLISSDSSNSMLYLVFLTLFQTSLFFLPLLSLAYYINYYYMTPTSSRDVPYTCIKSSSLSTTLYSSRKPHIHLCIRISTIVMFCLWISLMNQHFLVPCVRSSRRKRSFIRIAIFIIVFFWNSVCRTTVDFLNWLWKY